ncbi:MAG: hypothetical protein SGPRY_011546, partial [Prymnesium sp.]
MLLEVLNRLPNNETLRPHVQTMLSLCMHLLEIDNEENAVICLRIIFDLHKNFRPSLEREVQPFLEFVQKIYKGLPKSVQQVFADKPAPHQMAQRPPLRPNGGMPPQGGGGIDPSGLSGQIGGEPEGGARLPASGVLTKSTESCVINLLLTCPAESVSIRKDILVATRHILATDFRTGFFNQ